MRRIALALTLAAALSTAPTTAWDRTGHLVVARIAWEELSPTAREQAAELLAAAPEDADLRQLLPQTAKPLAERRAVHFQTAAYWPDLMRDGEFPERREKYHRSNWHWINHFFESREPENTPHERTDLEPRGELVARLGALVPSLSDASLPASQRAIHLAWVLHLGGDVHQPLHATARITETEPEGDRGGNLFPLNRRSNLHSFWDGILRSSNLRWFFQNDDSYVRKIAAAITRKHPRAGFGKRVESQDFATWARESFELAMESGYPVELVRYQKPPPSYAASALEIAEARVALAGYRLATVLEERLGH